MWVVKRNDHANPRRNNLHGLYYISSAKPAKHGMYTYLHKDNTENQSAIADSLWPYDKKSVVESPNTAYFATESDAIVFLMQNGHQTLIEF